MSNINCLIVDDEPIARDLLSHYCGHLPVLKVVGTCQNPLEAREVLKVQNVDILFLDINMPVMNGIQFLSALRHAPQVIFTTAYKEHASTAFDLHACDYLVKPFSLERFMVAVDKAMERLVKPSAPEVLSQQSALEEKYFFVKSDGRIHKIDFANLLYVEANGNTTRIITSTGTLTTNVTLTNFSQLLPGSIFIKVHRSFIINKSRINSIEGNRVFIEKIEIPIGLNYRESFMSALKV